MDQNTKKRELAKALAAVRREKAKGIDLRTRVADTDRIKKDAKRHRRQWKQTQNDRNRNIQEPD